MEIVAEHSLGFGARSARNADYLCARLNKRAAYALAEPGVGIGFIVGELFRTQSVFEKCLEFIVRERNLKTGAEKRSVTIEVEEGSYAEGRSIRSVLWPAGGMVTEVTARDGSRFVPGGSTMLNAGDKITFECVAVSEEELKNYLSEIVSAPR